MKLKFYKMSGAGNDFILIYENKSLATHRHLSAVQLAIKLCARKHSVGADGLLLLKRKSDKTLNVRYYNSDGSQAFCANGSRCAAWFAYSKKIIREKIFFLDTIKGKLPVTISGFCRNRPSTRCRMAVAGLLKDKMSGRVVLKMPDVNSIGFNFSGKYPKGIKRVHFLNTGVPHAVVPVKDINKLNVEFLGRAIRFNKCFGKQGANVDFVCFKNRNTRRMSRGVIYVRTYERGVEAETLACGTGCVAGAIALGILHKLKQPIHCITKSGETFRVWFKTDSQKCRNRPSTRCRMAVAGLLVVKDIYLEGPAKIVFKGEIDIE